MSVVLSLKVDVGVEHAREKFYRGVGCAKSESLKGAVFKGRVGWECCKGRRWVNWSAIKGREELPGPNVSVFHHDVVETRIGR